MSRLAARPEDSRTEFPKSVGERACRAHSWSPRSGRGRLGPEALRNWEREKLSTNLCLKNDFSFCLREILFIF